MEDHKPQGLVAATILTLCIKADDKALTLPVHGFPMQWIRLTLLLAHFTGLRRIRNSVKTSKEKLVYISSDLWCLLFFFLFFY
jgi:hypothetical protein